ncbi:uncharacterized protein LACBIDRAFT_300347 [Laccaria bicolor S238N-H82]|uniref:Predicted protein n=1 Tax=Laccaria bicolor (strain S238N-H82 / ATCC MYA-4686) TaxID=486041 RepID=B0DGJ6_LACBS|nr:uncharacterized protein LACBIDRAFT_300347 [Laccaria bicolor S238N-H82]EDR06280.1 predicted protein [Laccaria bicolor S238N-H82]|eukprot:XP_001883141.1 predicted protein [Laccaria bicolor S238N-H82]
MRHGDFSKWAVPEARLSKKYGFDRELFLPEPNQYAANKIFYNGKLWRLEKDPTRGKISFILRRTQDPFAAEPQYVAQIKLTTNHLNMRKLPIGKPGEIFDVHQDLPIKNVIISFFPLMVRQWTWINLDIIASMKFSV